MLRRIARGMKDGALGLAIKAYINDQLSDFGEVKDCAIDTQRSRIEITALLRGEKETVKAAVERYDLEFKGEHVYATLRSFSTSRPWLTLLLEKLFTGRRYKLPAAVGHLLKV